MATTKVIFSLDGEDAATASLTELVISRRLGAGCWVSIRAQYQSQAEMDRLAALLAAGLLRGKALTMRAVADLDTRVRVPLSPRALVNRVIPSDRDQPRVQLEGEVIPGADRDPFVPRWRANRGASLRELFDNFSGLVGLESTVSGRFADTTEVADPGFVIQAGESDFDHIHRLLSWASERWGLAPLGVTTRTENFDAPTYEVTWTSRAGLDAARFSSPEMKIFPKTPSSRWTLESIEVSPAPGARFTSGAPLPARVWQGDVQPSDFVEYLAVPLPFSDPGGAIIGATVDRLVLSTGDDLHWRSRRIALPPALSLPTAVRAARPQAELLSGTVVTGTRRGTDLEVMLVGFEPGADRAPARLLTIYSGRKGKTGVHLTPEPGTPVLILSTGRPGDPIYCPFNIRTEETAEDAPFLGLERELIGSLSPVTIRKVDTFNVQSTADLRFDQDVLAQLKKNFQLAVKGDSALDMTGEFTARMEKNLSVAAEKSFQMTGGENSRLGTNGRLDLIGDGLAVVLRDGKVEVG